MSKEVVLAIGGTDPTGGAGVQADLKTFVDHDVDGIFAVTAVTAQNEERILAVHPVPGDVLTQQLSTACKGCDVKAVKIGMLGNRANVRAVAWFLKNAKFKNVVIDPVLHSSSGAALLEQDAYTLFRQKLMPLARVITPNLSEASALAGMQVASLETMKTAAKMIHREAVRLQEGSKESFAVVVKGGHLDGDAIDLLFDGKDFHSFGASRVEGRSPRGTGCRFASSIAAYISKGMTTCDATSLAKEYLNSYIRG